MPNPDETRRPASYLQKIGRLRLLSAVAALAILIVLAGVYEIAHQRSNPADAACQAAVNTAKRIAPLARGEVAAFTPAHTPLRVPDLAFKDAKARDVALADWRGRAVLLNLWATWCVPCRHEMPALDALQALLGDSDFQVVAVNIDTQGPDRVAAFLDDNKIDKLGRYADPSTGILQSLKGEGLAQGLPTSVVIDGQGCRLAAMAGPAEWASDEAKAVIKAATGS